MYVRDMFCACCNALTCTFCKTVHLNDIHLAFLIYIYIYIHVHDIHFNLTVCYPFMLVAKPTTYTLWSNLAVKIKPF